MSLPNDAAELIRIDQMRQDIQILREMAVESELSEGRHWYGRAADLLEKGIRRRLNELPRTVG
jgi:hypothetical protein